LKISKRCVISGRVQGVFFRHFTQDIATALGLQGWVRNLDNGDVECLVCGEEVDVEKLIVWLHQGPPNAKVTAVNIYDAPWEDHQTFTVLR
jgi:acylphosphatase